LPLAGGRFAERTKAMPTLILKRAPIGPNQEDYDVLADGAVVAVQQRLDRGRDGEGVGVSVDETGDLQPKRQTIILQHGQRDRGDAEQ
jgi:hypothetical protein